MYWLFGLDWPNRFGFSGPGVNGSRYDFPVFWTAGMAVRQHAAINLYDHAQFGKWGLALLHFAPTPFLYPPTTLPLFAILSMLPLPASYDIFNLAILFISGFLLWRSNIPLWCIAVGLAGPAVVWNLCLGQLGLLCGALFVFGLARVDRHPWLGGLTLSFLALKPQYATLVPIAVLARRNWAALAAGALGLTLLAGLSLLFAHGSSWLDFLHQGRQAIYNLMAVPFTYAQAADSYEYYGTSVFWMLRSVHVGITASYATQGVISLLAIAAGWHVWRDDALPHLSRLLLMALLAMFATPYGYTDDLCAISVLLPTLARWHTPWRNAALAWLWSAPIFIPYITLSAHVLIAPLVLASALALAWMCRYEPAMNAPSRGAQVRLPPEAEAVLSG